jgi:hypothetical protein
VYSGSGVRVDPEDEQILAILRQLSSQIDYHRPNIETITWRSRIGARPMPADEVLVTRRTLNLSFRALGRLTPEEWRPILASGLVYQKNLGRWYFRALMTTMVPVIILLVPALLLDIRYLNGKIFLYDVVLISLIALTLFQGARLLLFLKKFWFRADEQAARILGKEQLISSLTKIRQIDQAATKATRGLFHPSVHERIRHLSSMPDVP